MNTRIRSRLERLEAQRKRAQQSVIRIGIVRRLPDDYVGQRHIAPVERGSPGTPGRMYDFEERPGPAPPGTYLDPGRIYIGEAEAML